jgi:hypothetical protein
MIQEKEKFVPQYIDVKKQLDDNDVINMNCNKRQQEHASNVQLPQSGEIMHVM